MLPSAFQPTRALLAAKAGAAYISPFVGGLDDLGLGGMELVREILTIKINDPSFNTEFLGSSIRISLHVKQAAMAGADIATIPSGCLEILRNIFFPRRLRQDGASFFRTR
ncbi:transaldolase family protein [Rhizobium ruizarguesonis]|uniref:transaldolase family protein n=1 Tax=Rhizobium ruizarguesonis TaxID=2081791 RepID=UPI001FE11893|nr:transaldolase family protein [Rhizobium ruizarguesonis]